MTRVVTNRIRVGMFIRSTVGNVREGWVLAKADQHRKTTIAAVLDCVLLCDGQQINMPLYANHKYEVLMTAADWRGDETPESIDMDASPVSWWAE